MFDLHTHTTASDGALTPSELVDLSVSLGLRYLAITDHDTISGIEEGIQSAKPYAIELIPGVELSVEVPGDEIHILGYFIDYKNPELIKKLDMLQAARRVRFSKILEKLKSEGISLEPGEVEKYQSGGSLGRPHIARAMTDAGAVRDIEEAFTKYLVKGAPAYVPRNKMVPAEAVRIIVNAGGIPVLAHPGSIENFSEHFDSLLDAGLMGIEAYYPAHNYELTAYFIEIAKKHNLTITAGTDFHGMSSKHIYQPGCFNVPFEVIIDFYKFCRSKNICCA